MTDNEWYLHWFNNPYYHKLYFERDDQEAETFINRLINYLHPEPGSRMLDIACGKGRHSKILASHGYSVTGIDIAPESISFAKQFENKNLEFFVHDMRRMFRSNYFHYAFNFFTSFGYFKTRREHDDSIRTLAVSLKPGGRIVMDYLNTHFAEEHLRAREEKQIGSTKYILLRWDDDSHFYKKISVEDPSLPTLLEYTEKVAKFSLGDFTDMFSYQGLQVDEVFGDYSFSHYHLRNSPRLILLATKKR